jgi:Domain of unknown function (DUF4907)
MVHRGGLAGVVCFGCSVLTIFLLCHISTVSGQSPTDAGQTPARNAQNIAKSKLTFKVISADGGGFGYDIYSDGRMLIHQPSIPGMPGNAGFSRKEDSQKVAELVIKKLKRGETPPAVSEEELRELKVIR